MSGLRAPAPAAVAPPAELTAFVLQLVCVKCGCAQYGPRPQTGALHCGGCTREVVSIEQASWLPVRRGARP